MAHNLYEGIGAPHSEAVYHRFSISSECEKDGLKKWTENQYKRKYYAVDY